jgi:hypothetical protein
MRLFVGVHPDAAEVVAETRFHEVLGFVIERLSGGAQHVVNDRRYFVWSTATFLPLQHALFFRALRALTFGFGFIAASAATLQHTSSRPAILREVE